MSHDLTSINPKTKRKPPSKIRRNRLRAENYRRQLFDKLRVKFAEGDVEGNRTPEPTKPRKSLKGTVSKLDKATEFLKKVKFIKSPHTLQEEIRQNTVTQLPGPAQRTPVQAQDPENGVNPQILYTSVEKNLRLGRLEEVQMLTTALRHVTRKLHAKGERVTFPSPEAVDRIQLKSHGLPTESGELLTLLKEAFKRRDEILDLEQVYKDFVKTHGRITVDIAQTWPHSHLHTRHP